MDVESKRKEKSNVLLIVGIVAIIIVGVFLFLFYWLVLRPTPPPPVGCTSNSDCGLGQVCNTATGTCNNVPCDPTTNPCAQGLVCVNGICTGQQCGPTVSCPTGQVCSNGTCVNNSNQCTSGIQCSGNDQVCINGTCVPGTPCLSNSDCSGIKNGVCNTSGNYCMVISNSQSFTQIGWNINQQRGDPIVLVQATWNINGPIAFGAANDDQFFLPIDGYYSVTLTFNYLIPTGSTVIFNMQQNDSLILYQSVLNPSVNINTTQFIIYNKNISNNNPSLYRIFVLIDITILGMSNLGSIDLTIQLLK